MIIRDWWENHGRIIGESWENYGKIMGKSWKNFEKYGRIIAMFENSGYVCNICNRFYCRPL